MKLTPGQHLVLTHLGGLHPRPYRSQVDGWGVIADQLVELGILERVYNSGKLRYRMTPMGHEVYLESKGS